MNYKPDQIISVTENGKTYQAKFIRYINRNNILVTRLSDGFIRVVTIK